MSITYKNFISKIVQLLPLILLFYISFKDDSIFHFEFFDFLSINFQYIIIYYWVLKKPKILGYGFIFFAGIITDVVLGFPMGISSLSYLTVATFATYTRIVTVRVSLLTDWVTFIPALLSANFIHFLVLYFHNLPIDYLYLLVGAIFTFAIYPFIWIIFELLRKLIKIGAYA